MVQGSISRGDLPGGMSFPAIDDVSRVVLQRIRLLEGILGNF
jgi:hypothetical protein